MADSVVQRSRAGPWRWLALLGGLVLLGLVAVLGIEAWYREPASAPAAPPGEPLPQISVPITDLHVILIAPAPLTLVGREVALRDVPVQQVMGASTFWIGEDARQRLLVSLQALPAEVLQPLSEVLRPGQRVAVAGTLRALPDGQGGLVLDAGNGEHTIFLLADRVEVLPR